MPTGQWVFPIHEGANPANQVIGMVLFNGDDIVAFISDRDFRDTNLDGNISWGESFFASVGFNRSIFVSTAIRELTDAITDPNAPTFDYNQINTIRYSNMLRGAVAVGTEVLQDAIFDALIGQFTGPVVDLILSRFSSSIIPQVLLSDAGRAWLQLLVAQTVETTPPDVSYGDYDVRFIGNSESQDLMLAGSGAGSSGQVVLATGTSRDLVTTERDDLVVISASGTSSVQGGLGSDTVIYDRLDAPGAQTIAAFGHAITDGVELFDGTRLYGVERVNFSTGSGNDTVGLGALPTSLTVELDLAGGDDAVTVFSTNTVLHGGTGTDTLIIDFRNADHVLRLSNLTARTGDVVSPGVGDEGGYSIHFRELDETRSYSLLTEGWAAGFERLIIYGSEGIDIIDTYQGDQTLIDPVAAALYEIDDEIHAGGGDDLIRSGQGVDLIDGGSGHDRVILHRFFNTQSFVVDGSFSTAAGLTLADGSVVRNVESLTIYLGDGNDTATDLVAGQIVGGLELDALTGGGNDVVQFFNPLSSADGGTGFDILTVDLSSTFDSISLQFLTDVSAYSLLVTNPAGQWIGGSYYQGFEQILFIGGSGGDSLSFSSLAETVHGGLGGDSIYGRDGDDRLYGDEGNDSLNGGAGADWLVGGAGDDNFETDGLDLIFENPGEGIDWVGSTASLYLFANIENLYLYAEAGDGFAVGNELDNEIGGNLGANLLIGGAGNDLINGGFEWMPQAEDLGDSLFGQEGNDRLYGMAGIDYLVGGTGDDLLDGGEDADALYGEDGNDTLFGGTSFHTDILVAGAGNDLLNGISGQADPDYDLMDGGGGDDIYRVDTGADLTFEAAGGGTDTVYANVTVPNAGVYLYANVENLVLEGNTAFGVGNELDNVLTGSGSANWLLGGAGNDRIIGGAGNDVLFGESGADTFVFSWGSGADLIGDFTPGEDRIDIRDLGYSWQDVLNSLHEYGGSTAIDLGNGRLVVLSGVTADQLHAGDFIFG